MYYAKITENNSSMLTQKKTTLNRFKLFENSNLASIYVDHNDHKSVVIAAENFAHDVYKVTGKVPAVSQRYDCICPQLVVFGTIDKSNAIKDLCDRGLIDTFQIKGKWESFLIQIVPNPWDGVESALVVAGSDKRGTVYGIYDLSERIGVSPWHWWADVAPDKQNTLVLEDCNMVKGPPSVKYRGIFINDESWGLVPWASETYAPEDSIHGTGLGPKVYAKLFELLLRMKANFLCPGMHVATRPFNFYEENKHLADDYGIIIGTSHCEPMLRNNEGEWRRLGKGPWRYDLNRDTIYKYWEDRIKTNHPFENVYTVGMRGIHDSPLEGEHGTNSVLRLLETIITDQRKMLSKWVNPEISTIPQALYMYKEVLDLYHAGLNVPDDVSLIWPDDNHGYIRELPSTKERQRAGGNGIYYHISYYGTPQAYLWLCSTPLELIAEEMTKAHCTGADRLWVVNIGNFKTHEVAMEFFLQMGWDFEKWNVETVNKYYTHWAQREFGQKFAGEIAAIKQQYFRLNYLRKPEHMSLGLFSHSAYGDEAQKHLDDYGDLVERAERIYNLLPDHKKDAFCQLVLYSLRSSYYMKQKFICAEKNNLYAKQGRKSALTQGDQSILAGKKIKEETDYYNNDMADGKWKLSVTDTPHGITGWTKSYTAPELTNIGSLPESGIGIHTENSEFEPNGTDTYTLPPLDVYTKRTSYFDLYNIGAKALKFTIKPQAEWIRVDKCQEIVIEDVRVHVSIDWKKVPKGQTIASSIQISGDCCEKVVHLTIANPVTPSPVEIRNHFIETDGYVAIDACHYNRLTGSNANIKEIVGFGRSGCPLLYLPKIDTDSDGNDTPKLEYDICLSSIGIAKIYVYCLPTHRINRKTPLRYSVALDDHTPEVIDFDAVENSQPWSANVLSAAAVTCSHHKVEHNGNHILKVGLLDPGVVIDRVIIDMGGLKKSYYGPPETRAVL